MLCSTRACVNSEAQRSMRSGPQDTDLTAPRSLWRAAALRLKRNRAAVTSGFVLAFIALAALAGPLLNGHPYDRVYIDYVKRPPSLAAVPTNEDIGPAVEKIAARMRAKVATLTVTAGVAQVAFTAERPIDERLLAYWPRSDLFGEAKVITRGDEGKALTLQVPIKYQRFLLGTDLNGRDLLARIFLGIKISFAVGILATAVALVIGVSYGAVAGYVGGRTDALMMRIVDVLYALPFIFFVIMLVVFFGRNFALMFIAVGAIEWLDMARIVRGQTLSIRRQEYVAAAEALGVSTIDILRRHVIPNTLGTVVVYMTLLIPKVILLESFLSFLGLGVQEPMTSLGVLIAEGARGIQGAASLLMFPAAALIAMLSALNFIGDGLRDALDPRDR
jgi:oligopeptide transport system permease protein